MSPDNSTVTEKQLAIAGYSTLSISAIGLSLNLFIFFKFASPRQISNGFYVLCLSKSISNSIICLIGLCWVGPAILINHLFLPIFFNKLLGQLNEYGIYLMGPLTQLLMAIDRFLIIFFPLGISDRQRCRVSVFSISLCWLICFGFVGITYKYKCWVYYSLKSLNYEAENEECDQMNLNILSYFCISLAASTITIQLSNFVGIMSLVNTVEF
ncbi:CRE-SRX-96 protein [Caenorhabditis remanei]|uniref:CRE-SRX-96 protein n=1 Tax=Caenorhabditis remanei TaxID=31234 RepID=E3M0C6_CAERE|nr:CRE-SRX-96 protein [Caenorhabditis remanei]